MAKGEFMPKTRAGCMPHTYMWHLPEGYTFEVSTVIQLVTKSWSVKPYKVKILLVSIKDPQNNIVGKGSSDYFKHAFWEAIVDARLHYKNLGISL